MKTDVRLTASFLSRYTVPMLHDLQTLDRNDFNSNKLQNYSFMRSILEQKGIIAISNFTKPNEDI